MKRTTTILVLLLAAGLLGACGGAGTDDGASDAAAPSSSAKKFLSLGTAPTGGAFFVVGGALAEVADQYGPESWEFTAEATQGSRENIRRLVQGDLDFALSNAAITYFAVRGQSSWTEAYDVKGVMNLAPNVALFVTPESSGVKTIADLKGRRVVIGPSGAGFDDFVEPLLAAHGVSYSDFTPLNAPQSAAVDMLSDASADAAFLGGAVPTASIVQASSSMDLYFVPFDEAVMEKLVADYPFYVPQTIPAGTYRNQDEDFHGLMVGFMHVITSAGQDEDEVYQFTKTIYENREAVIERHPAGRSIRPENVVRQRGTEFHPGAIRYYKEIGIWPEDEPAAAGEPAEDDAGGGE